MFPSTHWTQLAQATLTGDPAGRDALARLCEKYRPPVIAFLHARGVPRAEADDLAQELFQRLLTSRAWKRADPSRGKFRTFLLGILQHIMCSQWARGQAQKNGGGRPALSLEMLEDDSAWEPAAQTVEPSLEFDRAWALRTLRAAFQRVEARWTTAGRAREFDVYRRFLPGSQSQPDYAAVAVQLGVNEGAARTAVSRLRAELGEALRQEIGLTVAAPGDVESEMAYLRNVLASPGVDMASAVEPTQG
ncbi:MAG: RNA polymerase sigma factor [Verrucomicrobiales bacterium]